MSDFRETIREALRVRAREEGRDNRLLIRIEVGDTGVLVRARLGAAAGTLEHTHIASWREIDEANGLINPVAQAVQTAVRGVRDADK